MPKEEEQQHQLTQEGYNKLFQEMQTLKMDKLPAVLERLKEAISLGDISENQEYTNAQEEKNMIQARIAYLEKMLAQAEIVDESAVKTGFVGHGSHVILEEADEKKAQYQVTIASSSEVNTAGYISFTSPVGRAIKGKKAGDTVNINAPKGKYRLRIVSVK